MLGEVIVLEIMCILSCIAGALGKRHSGDGYMVRCNEKSVHVR